MELRFTRFLTAIGVMVLVLSGSCTGPDAKDSNTRPTEGGIGVPGYIICDKVLIEVSESSSESTLKITAPPGSVVSTTPGEFPDRLSLQLFDAGRTDLTGVQIGGDRANFGSTVLKEVHAERDGSLNVSAKWTPRPETRFPGIFVAENEADGNAGKVLLSPYPDKPTVAFSETKDTVTNSLTSCQPVGENRWSAPVKLFSSGLINGPMVKLDRNSNGVAIWTASVPPVPPATRSRRILYTSKFTWEGASAGWSTPEPLGDGTRTARPYLNMRSDGEASVAWADYSDLIWASRFTPAAGWSAPIQVSASGTTSEAPFALPTPSGMIVTWVVNRSELWGRVFVGDTAVTSERLDTSINSGPLGSLASNDVGAMAWLSSNGGARLRRIENAAFAGPNVVITDTKDSALSLVRQEVPQIQADPSGNALLVWDRIANGGREKVQSSYYEKNLGPRTLTSIDALGFAPLLASSDSLDSALTLFLSKGDEFVRMSRYNILTGWSRRSLPPGVVVVSKQVGMHLDPTTGKGAIVSAAAQNGYRLSVSRYENSKWSACAVLEEGPTTGVFTYDLPSVATSRTGKSLILWSRQEGSTSSLHFSKFE